MVKKNEKVEVIKIVPPKLATRNVTIVGLTPLLINKIPEDFDKKIKNLTDEEVFQRCLYPQVNGHHTFPAIGIKKSMINAAYTFAPSVPKTRVRGAFSIPIELMEIEGDGPHMRIDIGRNRMKGLVKVIRAEFRDWQTTFPIQYDVNGVLDLDTLINLLTIAGNSVGLGAWRPTCDGDFGRFAVKSV